MLRVRSQELRVKINHRRNGFTLIELILVLLIIGISAGLVGIAIGKGPNLRIKTLSKDVSAALRFARNQAITQKIKYCFVIDRNEKMFRVYMDKAVEGSDQESVDVLSKPIPDEVEMTLKGSDLDSPFIEFFPVGNSTGGVIELTNSRGAVFYVSVNRITGKVDVEQGES